MTEQLSFINNGKRYVTIFDASDFLKGFAEPNSNVCDASAIQVSGGASQAFKALAGIPVRDVPIMVDAEVDSSGPAWVVKGKAMKNGELTPVKITAMGITWECAVKPAIEEPTVEEPVKVEEPTVMEQVEESVIEESVTESVVEEPTAEETTVTTVEEPTENPSDTIIEHAKMTVDVSENKAEETPITEAITLAESEVPVALTAIKSYESEKVKEEHHTGEVEPDLGAAILEAMSIGTGVTQSSKFENCMNPPVIEVPCSVAGLVLKPIQPTNAGLSYKKPVAPKHGITFGIPESDGIRELAPGLVLGSESKPNTSGLCFGKSPEPIKPVVEEVQETEEVIEEHVKTEEEVNAELMERWKHSAPPDTLKKWDQPEVLVEAPVDTVAEEVVDTKALKESLRATYSEEVNEVIGQIPHQILGNISEFTTNSIDTKRLEVEGDIYCIDNRWHKCGKWYCIDVVQNKARYFYNSRLNVSIEIPLTICKEWLAVVS